MSGNVYVGEWIDDKRCGKGKQVYVNGKIEEGVWEFDLFMNTPGEETTNTKGETIIVYSDAVLDLIV